MKKLALIAALFAPALFAAGGYVKFEQDYIALKSQFGLCGHFSLTPAVDTLGNALRNLDRVKLVGQQWKADRFSKKDTGETLYRAGDVYSFGSNKPYRVYCKMRVPQGYVVNFDATGQPQVVPEGTPANTAATVQIQITGMQAGPETYVTVPCNKLFKLGEQSTVRSCLSPLAKQNKGNQELGMKD